MADVSSLTPEEEADIRLEVAECAPGHHTNQKARLLAALDAVRAERDEAMAACERGWNKDAHALRTQLASTEARRAELEARLMESRAERDVALQAKHEAEARREQALEQRDRAEDACKGHLQAVVERDALRAHAEALAGAMENGCDLTDEALTALAAFRAEHPEGK